MHNFEILDHTSDLAIRISGTNIDDLFHAAFDGFCALVEINSAVLSGEIFTHDIVIRGGDAEELLVRFLNELIRLIQEDMMAPENIVNLSIDEQNLTCKLNVRKFENFPDGYVEIKAATYHMLKITKEDGKLAATCILDI
ncbi:archease [bacterium]|nr:archease [bacterium]MBU1025342.1 archease [bacterium]